MTTPLLPLPLLAPDPGVPFLEEVLGADFLDRVVPLLVRSDRTEHVVVRVRARYRPGRSLRVTHRVRAAGRSQLVVTRTVGHWRSAGLAREAAEAGRAGPGPSVVHDAQTSSPSLALPWDRRMPQLVEAFERPPGLRQVVGSTWSRTTLAAYAPEKSATLRCLDPRGRTLAFVKLYADEHALVDAVDRATRLGTAGARVPRLLGTTPDLHAVVTAPVPGRQVARLPPADLSAGLAAHGRALATLHHLPVGGLPRSHRYDPARLHETATLIGTARPDCAAAVRRLAAALQAGMPEGLVLDREHVVHGDAHLPNGILDRGEVTLVDLDSAACGHPAEDLATVLGGLRRDRLVGWISPRREATLAHAFLASYERGAGGHARVDQDALRWHLAACLLVERGRRAVTGLVPEVLARLPELLTESLALLDPRVPLEGPAGWVS